MALLTLGTESPAVDVVLGMTATADHGWLDDVLGSDMALRAVHRGVCARQGEASARGVIEVAQVPAVGGVAGAAALTQRIFVGILLRMTVVAALRGLLEMLVGVTLAAGRHDV